VSRARDAADEPPAPSRGRAARDQQRREETRAAILESARHVFRQRGYHETSVADLVHHADVARGTFYLYFQNKQDILQELIAAFLASLRENVHRIATEPGAPPPLLQLHANFRRILHVVETHRDIAMVVLAGSGGLDEASRERVEEFWRRVEGMAEDALRVGHSLGLVRPCDPPTTAIMALGAARAALLRWLVGEPSGAAASAEALTEEIIAFVVRGVAALESDGSEAP
jgi:AcrR family transcriptional regulator